MAKRGEIVSAVDFGSRDIRVLIARKGGDGAIQIIGHGVTPSRGCIYQGVIQDLSAAQHALKRAVTAAEKEAGVRVHSLFCGVNGKNVETFIREGEVTLEEEEVHFTHLQQALDNASQDIAAPGKRVAFSITSQEWYVDELRISDPVGIRGTKLKVRVHFARLPAVIEDNLTTCIESQNIELEDVVFTPLAAALGCLTPEDLELGIAVIDMGRSTTGLSVYRDRRILGTYCFEIGGYNMAGDVAAGLHVSFEEAVDLILEYGVSHELIRAEEGSPPAKSNGNDPAAKNTQIKLKSAVRGAPSIVERGDLDAIVFERSKEVFTKVRQHLQSRGLIKNLVRGVVLTGGAAAIKHQAELAEVVFEVPVRIGLPDSIEILPQPVNAPEFVPVIGVIRHGFEYRAAQRSGRIKTQKSFPANVVGNVRGFLGRYFS